MNHKIYKILPYFSRSYDYWKETSFKTSEDKSVLGGFFNMNLYKRLNDGHYDQFDENGLPLRFSNGKPYYSFSTVFSYALANHQLYLMTAKEECLKPLFETVKFISKHGESTSNGGWGFPHHGVHSAMNQGEALSVIARAYEIDSKDEYLDKVEAILTPYEVEVSKGGVLGRIKQEGGIDWYEELAEHPGKHILNGMNYSLLGLHDIHKVLPSMAKAKELFDAGVSSLVKSLPYFDTGSWSDYWIHDEEPNYIASVMYHNLHIVQLRHLFDLTGEQAIAEYAEIFNRYNSSLYLRLKAGLTMTISKLGK